LGNGAGPGAAALHVHRAELAQPAPHLVHLVYGLIAEVNRGVIIRAPLPTVPQRGQIVRAAQLPRTDGGSRGSRWSQKDCDSVPIGRSLGGGMARSPSRRSRLRLVRHRPGPAHVRARVRADEPAPWKPVWRRIPWGHVGAVVGVVAAIGGLLFSGIATYYDAAISSDQLDQTRADAANESRRQAEHVWYWQEVRKGNGADLIHVANRSTDPVYDTYLFLYARAQAPGHQDFLTDLVVGDIGPCQEMVYQVGKLAYYGSGDSVAMSDFGRQVSERKWEIELDQMEFKDHTDIGWNRKGSHLQRAKQLFGDLGGPFSLTAEGYKARTVEGCQS
jgi:hypothetical protein